jgi:hypothetical protein
MERRLMRFGAVAAVVALCLAVAACGDDDGDDAATSDNSTPAAADQTVFCDSLVDFNAAVTKVELGPDSTADEVKSTGEQLAPIFQDVTDNAPDALASEAEELNTSVQALLQGDAAQFGADATMAKYGELVDGAIDACDFAVTDVTGVDYAFEGVPDTIDSGTHAFRFTNKSEAEDHEMVVLAKAPGATESFDQLLQLPDDEAQSKTVYEGSAQAAPGASSTALMQLEPGDYVMVCFLPVGGAEGGQPHFMEGMKHEFTVR